jgi:translation initiation factor IF-1
VQIKGGPYPELRARIVARLDVGEFVVELEDGRRLTCAWSDALERSRWEMSRGDVVKLAEVEPGRGVVFYRAPRPPTTHASAPVSNYRERLIAKGLLRPTGTFEPAPPPTLDAPRLPIDDAGRRAAEARVSTGGVDRDFDRERGER